MTSLSNLYQLLQDCETLARDPLTPAVSRNRFVEIVREYRRQLDEAQDAHWIQDRIQELYRFLRDFLARHAEARANHETIIAHLEDAMNAVLSERGAFSDQEGRVLFE